MTWVRTFRFYLILALVGVWAFPVTLAQVNSLNITSNPPEKLLSARTVALYNYRLTNDELKEFQRGFQRIGIDAVAYFPEDVVYAGKDAALAYAAYFTERNISYVLFLDKGVSGYQFTVTAFNQKPTLVDGTTPAWRVNNQKINELLGEVLRVSWQSQKKANYLVNDFPETDIKVEAIRGRRQEFYAIDLKVDNLAVPKFGDEAMDKALEEFFVANYPLRYKVVEAGADEKDLRSKGFLYVLAYVHTRGEAAKQVLDYDLSKGEKNYASITYPDGQLQLKILPKDEVIYKFYFRHIDNGNVFLGTKWDADTNWLDALRNHVLGFKQEAKIN
ncbi:MAG: hypothetical protein JNL40_11535 [Cyclobacteriaceae bacterium]|nr:hypothetical protein [Cyclobacteriaceae bacterium]